MLEEESGKKAVSKLCMGPRGVDLEAPAISIGRKIRSRRLKRELTLSQVSRETNLSASILSQIENEKTLPTLSTLSRLSDVYGVNISDILSVCNKNEAIFYKGKKPGEIKNVALETGILLLARHVGEKFLTESYLINHIYKRDIISSRYINTLEFIYVIEGSIIYRRENSSVMMSRGDSVLIHNQDGLDVYTVDQVPARIIKVVSSLR